MPRSVRGTAVDDLTVKDVLAAHAQFGQLNKASIKAAMGKNWPPEWDEIPEGKGIFEPPKPTSAHQQEQT